MKVSSGGNFDHSPPHGNFKKYQLLLNRPGKLFPPLSEDPLLCSDNSNVPVNFCIPLWNRGNHIKQILCNLQEVADTMNETNFKVWIADFHSTDIDLREYIKQFHISIEVITIKLPFIIAKGLQIVAEKIPKGEILYFIDADSVQPEKIFNRLRKYVIKGKQFYCPMVAFEQSDGSKWLPDKGKDHGGKGHIGVFSDDFQLCNGWRDPSHLTRIRIDGPGPMERKKWGGHDSHLYNKLRWDRLNCYRPRELDQWCRYHNRHNSSGTDWYNEDARGHTGSSNGTTRKRRQLK